MTRTASAQRLPSGENGIKVGDGRLHPYFQLDSRFIVNPGRLSGGSPPNDLVFVGRPGLELLLPSDTLDLKFDGDVEYQRYLGIQNSRTRDFSTFSGQLGLNIEMNKKGTIGFRIREKLLRGADAANETVSGRLLHISNDAGLGVDIRPGGGALIFSIDGGFFYDRYDRDSDALPTPEDLDNVRISPKLRVSWKFLPKTSVFLDAEGKITRYFSSSVNVPVNIFLIHLGASGSLSQKIALLLKAGYGNTFIGGGDNWQSFVGQAEFNYRATETSRFRAGLVRTVQSTSLFKYFALNRVYLGFDRALSGRMQLSLKVAYNFLSYGIALRGPEGRRLDSHITSDITFSYQATEWMILSVEDKLDWRASNYTPEVGPKIGYTNNDFFLRVGLRY
ncbi:MAG: outer membrane beta-barrel protein [Myxococcota bacterium]